MLMGLQLLCGCVVLRPCAGQHPSGVCDVERGEVAFLAGRSQGLSPLLSACMMPGTGGAYQEELAAWTGVDMSGSSSGVGENNASGPVLSGD